MSVDFRTRTVRAVREGAYTTVSQEPSHVTPQERWARC